MNGLLRWVTGAEHVAATPDGSVAFRFAASPAPWIMLAGGVAALFAVILIYRREGISTRLRWVLMGLRFGAILAVLFMIGRPMLVVSRVRTEPSYVAVVLDRSASMNVVDPGDPQRETGERTSATAPEDLPRPQTRWEELVNSLCAPQDGILAHILEKNAAGIWTFGQSVEHLGDLSQDDDLDTWRARLAGVRPSSARTNLGRALQRVLRDTQGKRLAAVVLLSDGRQTEPVDLDDVLSDMSGRRVGVASVAVGSPEARRDLAMMSVWAPREVFAADTVDVEVAVRASGLTEETAVRVELLDESDGRVLSSATATAIPGSSAIRSQLQFRPPRAGRIGLVARLSPLPGEERTENNEARTVLLARDDMPGVLFVESSPRFEYRYLKNLLLRERGIKSSCLLLDATADFPQEGSLPLRRFPRSIEELRPYDVIILGDVNVRRDWLSPAQRRLIVEFVSNLGGGITFLAGERNMPGSLRGTELEKLLPVAMDSDPYAADDAGDAASAANTPFKLELTPEGEKSPIFKLELDDARNEALLRMMPELHWFAKALAPQPGALMLARHPQAKTAIGPTPLVVMGRYGAGRTLYLGTDELWRWRQFGGDIFYETVWLQVIRTMARGKALAPESPWRLETDRRLYEAGEEVRVRLSVRDAPPPEGTGDVLVAVTDIDGVRVAEVVLRAEGGEEGAMVGSFVPPRVGNLVLTAASSHASTSYPPSHAASLFDRSRGLALETTITVSVFEPEQGVLEADYELLQAVAERTGGTFFTLTDNGARLAATIPDRSARIADDEQVPVWDNGLLLAVFVVMVMAEVALRRARGLA